MKRLTLALLVLGVAGGLLLVWGSPVGARLLDAPSAFYQPLVAGMISQVTQTAVYNYEAQFTGQTSVLVGGSPYTFTTRNTSSGTPIQKATQYVYERLQALGLNTTYHNWSSSYCSLSNRNVIGERPGQVTPNEIVVISAHLDDMPSSGAAPGADDNASGAVGVLMAAEILSGYPFERTLRFVFFTGEEQGLCGSDEYAYAADQRGDNIVAVYNLDMIAYDSTGGPTLRLHTRPTGNSGYAADLAIAGVFTNVVQAYGLSGVLTPIITADGDDGSDHWSFWDYGYPAIMAIEDDYDDWNTYYHTANDALNRINLTYFTNFVKASVGTAAHLARPRIISLPPRAYLPLVRRS